MKTLGKILDWLISPLMVGVAVTAASLYVAYQYYDRYQNSEYDGESAFFDLVREMHQKSVDFRVTSRGPAPGHPDVAVLAIDEASVEQEGRWPWPREKIAAVVDRVVNLGAKAVAFDILFSEEDANSSMSTLARLRDDFGEKNALSPDLQNVFAAEIENADSDAKFGGVIKKHADRLILGAYFEEFDKSSLEAVSPFIDMCLDTLYERSPAYAYWSRNQRSPSVRDDHQRAEAFPDALKLDLATYFDALEANAVRKYLQEEKQDLSRRFMSDLRAFGIPEGAEPGFFVQQAIAGERETLAEILNEALGPGEGPGAAEKVFASFEKHFSKKDIAIIKERMRTRTNEYCFRFLNTGNAESARNDELLDPRAFEELYPEMDFNEFSWASKWAHANKSGKELPAAEMGDYLAKIRTDPRRNQVTPIDKWWTNIPVLAAGTKHSAFFNAFLDSDGTVRRNMFLARRGHAYYSSLSLTSFLVAKGLAVSAVVTPSLTDPTRKGIPIEGVTFEDAALGPESGGRRGPAAATDKAVAGFRVINSEGEDVMSVPVDPSGRMLINYAGPKYSFAHVSAADILADGEDMLVRYRHYDPSTQRVETVMRVNKKEFLRDKVLFFGATATGIYDLRVTPFEENFPGVETHANMLSNLFVEYARAAGTAVEKAAVAGMPGFLRSYPEREAQIMLPAMLAVGFLLSALLTYFGSIAGLAITTLSLGGVYALDRFALFSSGVVTTVLFPISQISALFVSLTFYKYFTEERKKRELKGTFEKYVSPAIVNEILSDPSNIELGGKKMDLTVMFSDVRGFTTISEKLDPRALSDLLNSYLTPMTNLVFEHKGTLDKYMGDAIMAFWGAPIHFPDHAKHAARCALKMLDRLRELQAEYRAKGLPEIDIGIGLNTGEMSVGNMGSDTVRSYTVMGDAVNLGSRLEGINKEYGTRIIVSEFTREAIKDRFVCREIDWVRVKGKAQPVRIFELVAEAGVPPETQRLLDVFQKGFDAYHARDWDAAIAFFTEALNLKPDDEPSHLYLDRCHEYKQSAPPDAWDGVFTMTTK